jgi:ribonucleoside-diphosphate reductase alpha chain
LNLTAFYSEGKFHWDKLQNCIADCVEFLDDVISASHFPLPQIDEMVKGNRKIGLGIMGWADLLYMLNIPYNSPEAVSLAGDVMEFIDFHAKEASLALAKQNGSFPNYPESIYTRGNLHRTIGIWIGNRL